jgi:hypothetical protein
VGGVEARLSGRVEPSVKYHSLHIRSLTRIHQIRGQCLVGSLAGAVSSERVTEERDGALSVVSNHTQSVRV